MTEFISLSTNPYSRPPSLAKRTIFFLVVDVVAELIRKSNWNIFVVCDCRQSQYLFAFSVEFMHGLWKKMAHVFVHVVVGFFFHAMEHIRNIDLKASNSPEHEHVETGIDIGI